jgi:vacuolar-type H+-ATPase subunit E/Vma4
VSLLSERDEILRNILDIESQLRAMKKNPDYVTTQRSLKYLEEKRFGSKLVTVASPEDYSVNLSVRRSSVEFQDIILRYKEKQTELNEQMYVLTSRRKRLIKQLFSS